MSGARRYLSRPRTKLYDCNYTMGERMYRNVVDSLDKPRGSRTSAEAVERPTYTSYQPAARSSRGRSADDYEEDDSILKIRAARAKMEDEVRAFEEASNARRAAIKSSGRVDVSDRLMDSVGIRRSAENGDYQFSSQSRRAVSELEEEPFFRKKTFQSKFQLDDEEEAPVSRLKSKQRFLESSSPDFDTNAALERAKKSRARLAEIDSEMDELNERTKARSARIAAARDVLREAAECESTVSATATKSVRVSKRAIQVTERIG